MDESKLEIPQEIRSFLESLLQDAGMTTLDEQGREDMLQELYVRLDNFLTSKIIDNMPPEHLDEFIKMNEEKKDKATIEKFMQDKIPDAQNVFTKAFLEFRDIYLGNVAASRNAPADTDKNDGAKNPVT